VKCEELTSSTRIVQVSSAPVERVPRQSDHVVLLGDRLHSVSRISAACQAKLTSARADNLSGDTTLYANVLYQSRFDGGGSSYDGKMGVRFTW
jgi:hypothetical protein